MTIILKCNTTNDKEVITMNNVIGIDQLRLFFVRNGWAMTDYEVEYIMDIMGIGEYAEFVFPNKVKKICVLKNA